MSEHLSTGIFIPENKKVAFILAFEQSLASLYACIPRFGLVRENSCEVKLQYANPTYPGRLSAGHNFKKAKTFIQQHLNEVLYHNTVKKKKAEVINLDEKNLPFKQKIKTIDLTGADSEVIVLDETLNDLDKSIIQLDATLDSIFNEESDIQIINVNKKRSALCDSVSVFKSGHDNKIKIVGSSSKWKRSKNNKKCRCTKVNGNDAANLQNDDIEIISTPRLMSASPSPYKLSEGVQKYYKTLNTVVDKEKTRKKTSNHSSIQYLLKRNRSSLQRNKKPIEKMKSKVFRKLLTNQSACSHISQTQTCSKSIGSSNVFNPNPVVVDVEGLRPIVIDGSNVAFGHGKGRFSVKGIKICVDYFHIRGHSVVKIILPMCRKKYFSDELLYDLGQKAHLVFTPSILIDGIRKTPYDDRYIVQYADEFGGVIVSTDNYRDLLKENPKWRNTILNRLLMFTWVDNFLMFPMDPLGRKGPTLSEFLRF